MAESEEKGYDVVDKRKVKLGKDGEAQVEPEAQASEAQPQEMPEEAEAKEQPVSEETAHFPPVDAYSLLKSFIGLLGAHAWQWMGLVKNPVTGEMEKDLAQAKVAIDSISALINQLEGKVEPSEQLELRGLLSDLQVNFVQQSAKH